eukprot:CAMPEP_0184654314 /NCGR_PEP_ID=MMETSP0308-20130426/12004_1 /TAXON_ID=38269 /ORGANISM="Gloeochaete witrockiana, Strain SAG 46.84" /LENGTH=48 /DNA_ID= /DNA_START= /DNA_END= /DNA_ORIENTATION=
MAKAYAEGFEDESSKGFLSESVREFLSESLRGFLFYFLFLLRCAFCLE